MTDVDGIKLSIKMYQDGKEDAINRVLEIVAELKNENIGRDGSDEYTSACQDFRAAVMELKGGEQE